MEGYDGLFGNPTATLTTDNASQARIRLHDITEATNGYIGHDAQIDVTSTDFAGNSGTFTMTLRLGHGIAALDDTNDSTNNGAGTANVVTNPILNVIGILGDIHNGSDATDTTGGSDDSVE